MTPAKARRTTRPRWLGVLLLSLVVGCASVGERLVPWYITRTLAGYFDLSSEQKQDARTSVDETLALIRQVELPQWINLLREVRQGVHDGLAEDDVTRLQRRYDARLDAGVQLLSPRLAAILVQLTPAQLDHFAARMHEDVDDQYKELRLPTPKRTAAIEKRAIKAVEDAVGDLTETQQETVRALTRALPNERAAQYRSAQEHIDAFRAFMAQRPAQASIELELRALWEHRYDALGPGHDKAARRAQQRQWLYGVYRMLDSEQRTHLEEELTDRVVSLKRFMVDG